MVAVMTPDEFEAKLARYLYERSEEARAVRVGEKETSEQAAIVERYAGLFTRDQHLALREAEEEARGEERERLYRLREAAAGGVIVRELVEESDALENSILAARVEFRGETLPLRAAQARLAVLDDYAARDELGELAADASAGFNCPRHGLMQKGEALDAELSDDPDPVGRSAARKNIDLYALSEALRAAVRLQDDSWQALREEWLDRVLGAERDAEPRSHQVSYLRRMSPFADLYAKERSVPICLETLSALGFDLASNGGIKLDLDDRPQKSPRACVIASDPPSVVHLITRAQGGLHDYQAFLHEAGHALHYAGLDPELPYTFRRLSRDHALTEIYSFLLESITREPGWHTLHFGVDEAEDADRAEAARFLEVLLFRRYAAKLAYELELWSDFENASDHAKTYEDNLRAAVGFRYRADGYLVDMDGDFYSADYLRAWIRTAQLRAHLRSTIGEDWWRRPETGELLRALFREGTRPTSEEIADRIGFDPLDTAPLVEELVAA
ncbi:MAG TPA: hypothetical protein VLA87_05560 [Gaiellaceae bacterium]|nr:hypothetical protein [Gaiellaceae bacterium]